MTEKPHSGSDDHGHDAHGHHGSVFIQHHYDDAQHQFDSGKFGIWLFLAQEVLFFSALFVAYVLYRHHHPEIYQYAHKYLDVKYGAINTAVLIFSSLTAAWAVRAAQLRQKALLVGCIAVTLMCALAFLVIKYIEYTHKVHEHILFGKYFDPCVSSGGRPLLTKNNKCAGHESSVVWNAATARAEAGCFPDYAIDQETSKLGVQASCSTQEVKLNYSFTWGAAKKEEGPFFPIAKCNSARTPKLADLARKLKPLDDKIAAAKKKKQDTRQLEDERKQLADAEKVGECTEHEKPVRPIMEQCPEWRPSSQPQVKAKYPCWRPGFQPEVCPISWSFTWRDGDATKFAGPYMSEDECQKFQKLKAEELKDKGPAPTACLRSGAVGVIVEYGNHNTLARDLRIKAECKGPPPPPPPPADPLADTEQKLELGKKQATGQTHTESNHDAHEREYAGPPPEHTNMFFTIYFAMTGLHGIHVLVGVFVFIWLLIRAIKGQFSPDYFGPVDYAALYWHIVDLIWIFLFPLLYLIH